MKKTFTVKAYEACDLTSDWTLIDYVETIFEAQENIRFDDLERREGWRQSQWYNHGRVNPFEHHEYAVIEWVGTAELEVDDDDDDYVPSFAELCDAVSDWEHGDYCEVYRFSN